MSYLDSHFSFLDDVYSITNFIMNFFCNVLQSFRSFLLYLRRRRKYGIVFLYQALDFFFLELLWKSPLSSFQLKLMFWKRLRECSCSLWSFCSDQFFPIENEWVKDTTNLDQHFSDRSLRWFIFCCCSDFFFLFDIFGEI